MYSISQAFQNYFPVAPLRLCAEATKMLQTSAYKLATAGVFFFSSKQTMRVETLRENLSFVVPKIRESLASRCWPIQAIFNGQFLDNEFLGYLTVLGSLNKIKEGELLFNGQRTALRDFFEHALKDRNYPLKFEYCVASKMNPEYISAHHICKHLLSILDDEYLFTFLSKIDRLSKLSDKDLDTLSNDEKLNVNDISLLINASARKILVAGLAINGIDVGDLLVKWTMVEGLSRSPFIEKLRKICSESRNSGSIFLGDRVTFDALNGRNFRLKSAIRELFMGRIGHMGIYLVPQGKGLHLSHMSQITRTHDVAALRSPIATPFTFSLELDITSLIPPSAKGHQGLLQDTFLKALVKYAEEPHKEIPLGGAKEQLKVLLWGHKNICRQALESVRLPGKKPTLCSSYVGIIFLMAIKDVNQKLGDLGYRERIAHPFGERENLENLDILRLIYLWNQIKVIRPTKVHPDLHKYFAMANPLPYLPKTN